MAEDKVHEAAASAGGPVPPYNGAGKVEYKAQDAIESVDEALRHYHSTEGHGSDSSMTKVIQNAKAATEKEQNMSLMEGFKLYPKAVAWSVLISTCIVMEGYDISLVNNFYAFTQFNKKYGTLQADGSYEVSASVSQYGSTLPPPIGLV
jgi:SP family general alpha glucoside:H+ symporter-like MFS transporter